MILQEVLTRLRDAGREVAFDPGVHWRCPIDSRCKTAEKLRAVLAEAGIDRSALPVATRIDPFTTMTDQMIAPAAEIERLIEGQLQVRINGTVMTIPATDLIRPPVRNALISAIEKLRTHRNALVSYQCRLQSDYDRAVYDARRQRVLPQLQVACYDLIKERATIGADRSDYYVAFQVEYNPQWLVTMGVRYELHPEDVVRLRRPAVLMFRAQPGGRQPTVTLNHWDESRGRLVKLEHYHGDRSTDCWGDNVLPVWDDSFDQLVRLRDRLMGALQTINYDSLLKKEPLGMPSSLEIRERVIRLGTEGVVDEVVEVAVVDEPDEATNYDDDDSLEELADDPLETLPEERMPADVLRGINRTLTGVQYQRPGQMPETAVPIPATYAETADEVAAPTTRGWVV